MMVTLHRELPNATLLAISLHGDEDHFYDRKLVLRRPEEAGIESAKVAVMGLR
jgi:hypothetical protein